ncbi:olfactory receptor 1J4-like [Echinops telfairi]|uniref:Olfactory receptor n=1 Tax=Echinops telfairi TaxID=9371 RepID=A0ABM0ZSV4_ECHTE|nr:olfactory receptor 1J4-like [Echinops telfairi]
MRRDNQSSVSEFLLLGLPIRPEQQGVFFALFLAMYLTTVLGNLLIILLIRLDSHLHTPMYFFLNHLALSDISLSSVTVPRMLMNMKTHHHSISYIGCILQVYFFILFACVDNLLLAVMAYDRYVAICHPLHYTTIMRGDLCLFLAAGCWLLSCAHGLLHTLLMVQLSFCEETTIPHFFCDLAAVIKASCSDASLHELVIFTEGGLFFIVPLSSIFGSYICMVVTILKVLSIKRISKALSTCGSHLVVVSLYYGTLAGVYFFSSSGTAQDKDAIASVMYMVVLTIIRAQSHETNGEDSSSSLDHTNCRRSPEDGESPSDSDVHL